MTPDDPPSDPPVHDEGDSGSAADGDADTDRAAGTGRDGDPDADCGSDAALVAETVDLAAATLRDRGIDCWLTFCRETTAVPDPSLPLLLDFEVVWPTAVLVFADGRSDVVLGRYDAPGARELGVHRVHGYDESIREPLAAVVRDRDPGQVAVNYDRDDPMADGLSHGLYVRLTELLPAPYDDRLVCGGDVVATVRGQKTPTERARIERAVDTTRRLLRAVGDRWRPDWTERSVAEFLHDRMDDLGVGAAWDRAHCPTVHAGDAPVGHTAPGDRRVATGEVLHLDFGVRVDGYVADVQRCYVRGDAPRAVREAFEDVRAALEAGRAALEPGVAGHEVDQVAREALTDRGRPEVAHAFGHQVGRHAHDGGTLLGPRWERYGRTPDRSVSAGEVYAIELGVETDRGYVGLEEVVRVDEAGARYLADPQTDLWRLG